MFLTSGHAVSKVCSYMLAVSRALLTSSLISALSFYLHQSSMKMCAYFLPREQSIASYVRDPAARVLVSPHRQKRLKTRVCCFGGNSCPHPAVANRPLPANFRVA